VRTLAVTNQKGGSAKTTTAVNLAAALAEKGKRVLVVDLDPQASASSWLGVKDGGKGLYEVFADNGNLADLARETDVPGLALVPASGWLVGLERALAGEPGAETIFRRALRRLPRNRWDFVFVDCPPSLGFLAVSALVACEEVLVPVEASTLALAGLAALVQTVERVQDRLNPDLRLSAVLVCRVDSKTNLSRELVERLRERFGALVFRTVIRETVRLREAWSFSQPVTVYASRSPGAEDYRAVAAEILKRTNPRTTAKVAARGRA
jgi:chromosome partitioning protein